MNDFNLIPHLMKLTENQFIAADLFLTFLFSLILLTIVSAIVFAFYSNILHTHFKLKFRLLSLVSGLLAIALISPFFHFIKNTSVKDYTRNLNQKYFIAEISRSRFHLYQKLENEKLSSQVSVVDKNKFIGELKCGDLSLIECFNQVQTLEISSTDLNNVILVSKNSK